jgi:allophanate hydrolase subunit 2
VRRELGAPAQGGPRLEVRVIPGPNLEFFSPRGLEAFFGSDYTLSGETDRRGMRLEGPPVELAPDMPSSIVSEPNSPGVIQIPVGGAPIILLREQTVGGYAKIAAVISADLDLLARALPGTVLRFQKATREEALAVLRRRNAVLESLRPGDGP